MLREFIPTMHADSKMPIKTKYPHVHEHLQMHAPQSLTSRHLITNAALLIAPTASACSTNSLEHLVCVAEQHDCSGVGS
jgi:hypothetical protein